MTAAATQSGQPATPQPSSCEGTTCGVPGTVRELREWSAALSISRTEFYGTLAALSVVAMICIALWKIESIGRVLNERARIRLENKRHDEMLRHKLENVRSSRRGKRR